MAGRNDFRVLEIGHLLGLQLGKCRTVGKNHARPNNKKSHCSLRIGGAAVARPPRGNYFGILKAISVEAAGTFSSCGKRAGIRRAAYDPHPLGTRRYCSPSIAYVTMPPRIPEPVLKLHRTFPVSASKA